MVVADTSSVNYAILIEEIEVLHRLYGTIAIPAAVLDELTNRRTPEKVRNWIANRPDWIEVHSVASRSDQMLSHLGPGEQEAISLAEHLGTTLLIDESDGRVAARQMGLPMTGLLGALRDAGERELTDFKRAVKKLQRTTFPPVTASFEVVPRKVLMPGPHPRSFAAQDNYPPAFGNCSRYLQIASISGGENL